MFLCYDAVMKKIIILIVAGVILLIVLGVIVFLPKSPTTAINSFQECADAGYAVQQTFPEVCAVPGGKSFTNN